MWSTIIMQENKSSAEQSNPVHTEGRRGKEGYRQWIYCEFLKIRKFSVTDKLKLVIK